MDDNRFEARPPGGRLRSTVTRASRGVDRRDADRRARSGHAGLVAVVGVVLGVGGLFFGQGVVAPEPAGAVVAAHDVAGVQALYAEDLVARINAERAARSTSAIPIPQLQVNQSLQADAQAWSAHLAAVGTVSDPSLPACIGPGGAPPPAGQQCVLAANSASTGYGFWPGDGSDGMNADYMNSSGHRQNMLASAYSDVGVGVTCSANQAWTVELFGSAYANMAAANARQAVQNLYEGNPVASSPMVAGVPSGDPVYCPGQTDGPAGAVSATGGQQPYPYAVPAVPGEPITSMAAPVVGMADTSDGAGYWLARADGSVSAHGNAVNYGSMAGAPLAAPISHVVATADGNGYWLVASDGGIFSFGDAKFYGSMGGQPLNAPVVGIAPTADGRGYWMVASDGGIFAFGDAVFHGSMGGHPLNAPVVGLATDAPGNGYWLVASDGGVFSFGAPFHGSTGGIHLNLPVNGIAATAGGGGYWFVASDGGIFAFGDAGFHGSAGGLPLNAAIAGMAADRATGGYWMVATDGGIFSYGAPFFGAG